MALPDLSRLSLGERTGVLPMEELPAELLPNLLLGTAVDRYDLCEKVTKYCQASLARGQACDQQRIWRYVLERLEFPVTRPVGVSESQWAVKICSMIKRPARVFDLQPNQWEAVFEWLTPILTEHVPDNVFFHPQREGDDEDEDFHLAPIIGWENTGFGHRLRHLRSFFIAFPNIVTRSDLVRWALFESPIGTGVVSIFSATTGLTAEQIVWGHASCPPLFDYKYFWEPDTTHQNAGDTQYNVPDALLQIVRKWNETHGEALNERVNRLGRDCFLWWITRGLVDPFQDIDDEGWTMRTHSRELGLVYQTEIWATFWQCGDSVSHARRFGFLLQLQQLTEKAIRQGILGFQNAGEQVFVNMQTDWVGFEPGALARSMPERDYYAVAAALVRQAFDTLKDPVRTDLLSPFYDIFLKKLLLARFPMGTLIPSGRSGGEQVVFINPAFLHGTLELLLVFTEDLVESYRDYERFMEFILGPFYVPTERSKESSDLFSAVVDFFGRWLMDEMGRKTYKIDVDQWNKSVREWRRRAFTPGEAAPPQQYYEDEEEQRDV